MNMNAVNVINSFIAAHILAVVLGVGYLVAWAVSAYASTLQPPAPMASPFQRWWYAFVHLAAANLDRFREKK